MRACPRDVTRGTVRAIIILLHPDWLFDAINHCRNEGGIMGIIEQAKGVTEKIEEKVRKEGSELIDTQAQKIKAKGEELLDKVSKDTTNEGKELKEEIKGKVTK